MSEKMPTVGEKTERNENIKFIVERARELYGEMEKNFTDFHENPELGGEEFETAKKVKKYLEDLGIEIVDEGVGGSGIVAKIEGKKDGPTIALRADMDALPMKESEDNEPRSKKEGAMHGCGHDLHTAGLMGSAKILKELAEKGELEGNVILLFQPSEEKAHQKTSGAVRMIRSLEKKGLRKEIDAFFGLHVDRQNERGNINLKEGVQMASSGEFDIKLKSSGGHIMSAYEVPNLHLIFSKLTLRLADVFKKSSEKRKAHIAAARTSYEGASYNVLPAEAESTWVLRLAKENYEKLPDKLIKYIKKTIEEILEEEGVKEEVEVEINRRPGYRPVIHRSPKLVKTAAESAKQVVDGYQRTEKTLMGGEDFSFYLEKFRGKEIPGAFVMVGAANPEKGIPAGSHHTPDFRVDNDVLRDLASLYSSFTVNAIESLKK